MTETEILEKVQIIFRQVFTNKDLIITNETNADDISEWDSLTHLELLSDIEKQMAINFSFDEVIKFNNVNDIIKSIHDKLSK
jgi:acyl carrier protein